MLNKDFTIIHYADVYFIPNISDNVQERIQGSREFPLTASHFQEWEDEERSWKWWNVANKTITMTEMVLTSYRFTKTPMIRNYTKTAFGPGYTAFCCLCMRPSWTAHTHSPEPWRYWKCPVRRSSELCSGRGEEASGEGGGWAWQALSLGQPSAESPFWRFRYSWRCCSTSFMQFRCSWPQKICQVRNGGAKFPIKLMTFLKIWWKKLCVCIHCYEVIVGC